jgi:hypothetical protein
MSLQDYFSPNIEDRRDEQYMPDPLHRLLPPQATPQQVLEHQMVLDRPNPYVEMFAPRRSQPVFGLSPPRPFLPQQQNPYAPTGYGMPQIFAGEPAPQQRDIFSRAPSAGGGFGGPVDNWSRMPRIEGGRSIADILATLGN